MSSERNKPELTKSDAVPSSTGGARLRPHLTEAMLVAALDQLEESGYERLSMEQVARRAGVGKAALYRRWPGKLAMVVDALARLRVPVPSMAQTSSLDETAREMVRGVLEWLTSPRVSALLPDLLAQAQRHPELAAAVREQIGGPRRTFADRVLQQWTSADENGRLARELAVDLLAAPIYWRLSQHLEIDDDYLDRLADVVVDVLTADADRRRGDCT